MAESSKDPPSAEKIAALLDEISNLSMSVDDTNYILQFLLDNAQYTEETEQVIEIYKRLLFAVVRNIELDRKVSKKMCSHIILAIQNHPNHRRILDTVYQTLLSLPMLIQSRWDLITLLATSNMIPQVEDYLFDEVWACAFDQTLAARCSSTVLYMASSERNYERMAELLFKGTTSPVAALRNNVQRSWLGRVLSVKASQKCIEKVLDLLRNEASKHDGKMWPVTFREIPGMTCVDLQWKPVLDEDPCETLSLVLSAYTLILVTTLNSSSQVKVKLTNDDPLITRGISYYCPSVARQAFLVCSKYKIAPRNLESAALFETTSGRMLEIFEILDDDMLKHFSKGGQTTFTREKCKYNLLLETETKARQAAAAGKQPVKKTKFYPAEDNGNLKVETRMSTERLAMETLHRFFNVQTPEGSNVLYPSVACVMEHLGNQGIDNRLFSQKVCILCTLVVAQYKARKFSRKITTEFLFLAITHIPLRSVVDHVGDILKEECAKDSLFREKIFFLAYGLILRDDENARPLSLGHCLRATVYKETEKVTRIWEAIKELKVGEKKRKMCEMMAKVISHSAINVDEEDLYDMVLSTLGFVEFGVESTQLFVAALCKVLRFRHETERIMLFAAFEEDPELLKLIETILSHPSKDFSNSSFQMVLYLFTRFHLGSFEFYTSEQLRIVTKIINFCHWCIRKFAGEPMYLGLAVDAICGYLPWEWIRERSLHSETPVDTDDPVEKLISQNMRHHRYWVLLSKDEQKDQVYMTMEDFELLPTTKLIREIRTAQTNGMTDAKRAELVVKLRDQLKGGCNYEELHAASFAFGMFADELRDLISRLRQKNVPNDWKHRNHIFTSALVEIGTGFEACNPEYNHKLSNSWLGKALSKLQDLTDYLSY